MTRGDQAIELAKKVRKTRALSNSAALLFGKTSPLAIAAKSEMLAAQNEATNFMR
ncbi:hypothetical protein SEA_FRANKLIN22_53 [Microbacterium phage Franklin22]|uniref:hypothetical protein n=1 Tax=Microbacterium phage Franklin22 TaxID=2894293 RepID=UPI001E76B7E2|nr:hypothetical protein QDW15_gp53 [Microbacterium phage Franklin22]UGL61866.1 hypothetical protein SEA_FRANKLIN22_53 [Microbacterium phage Franklin22]